MLVGFLPHQKVLYDNEDTHCLYELHHTRKGIHKKGANFYAMVAKKLFVDLGYKAQHT